MFVCSLNITLASLHYTHTMTLVGGTQVLAPQDDVGRPAQPLLLRPAIITMENMVEIFQGVC